MPINLDDVF